MTAPHRFGKPMVPLPVELAKRKLTQLYLRFGQFHFRGSAQQLIGLGVVSHGVHSVQVIIREEVEASAVPL